jgi:tetratricopeptide (TPR) repeat protein
MEKAPRWRDVPRCLAILLLLLTLILAPRPLAGFLDLAQARRLQAGGDLASAVSAYASAAQRLPWQPSLWQKAGELAWFAGDIQDAFDYLEQAAGRDALSSSDWVTLGQLYQQRGDISSAVAAWERGLPSAEAYRLLAQAARSLGDLSAAQADWQASLALDPDDATAHYQLGLLLAANSPGEALPELVQATRLDADLEPQIQSLRTALNRAFLSDDQAYQFLVAGQTLGALGEWDLAAAAFHHAIRADPGYAEAWAWLGETEQQQGQDGRIEIETALLFDPGSALVESLYGVYLQRQGKAQEALSAFQQAVAIEPQDPGWQMALASAYEQTGDLVAALEHYQAAVELSPGEATGWQALALFSLRNDVDLTGVGLPAARRLMELAGDDWQSFDIAGQILLDTGDPVGAEVLLKKALDLDPTQAAPSLHLGLLYLQTGEWTESYTYLVQAKNLDPEGLNGWQAGRLLEQYFP